jgi:hypothetical protein
MIGGEVLEGRNSRPLQLIGIREPPVQIVTAGIPPATIMISSHDGHG